MSAVAIIPAKGHSNRIPGKNLKAFHGRPIFAYSIDAARESWLFDTIIVSTDSHEIAVMAPMWGAWVMLRPEAMTRDEIGTQEVAAYHLNELRSEKYDHACCIYATAPMLQPWDLVAGFALLKEHPFAYVPGIYYWGTTKAFLDGVPLERGIEVPFPKDRYIDINTPEDWAMAEKMYEAINVF